MTVIVKQCELFNNNQQYNIFRKKKIDDSPNSYHELKNRQPPRSQSLIDYFRQPTHILISIGYINLHS